MGLRDQLRFEFGGDIAEAMSPDDPIRQKLESVMDAADRDPLDGLLEVVKFLRDEDKLVERRNEMMDAALEWFRYHGHHVLEQAERRKMSGLEFVKNMLDDVLDVYQSQSDLDIDIEEESDTREG
jgi:hypothetical protein